jgi:hypothetical protein
MHSEELYHKQTDIQPFYSEITFIYFEITIHHSELFLNKQKCFYENRRQCLLIQEPLHLCIDFALFFLSVKKKPTAVNQQSATFSIFLSNSYHVNEGCYSSMLCANISTFRERRTKACAPTNFFLSFCGWLLRHKRHTVFFLGNKTRFDGVLSSLFEYIHCSFIKTMRLFAKNA